MHGASPFCSETSQLLDFYAIQVSSFRLGLFLDTEGQILRGAQFVIGRDEGKEATEELLVAL